MVTGQGGVVEEQTDKWSDYKFEELLAQRCGVVIVNSYIETSFKVLSISL